MMNRDSRRLSPAAQEELRRRAVAAVQNGSTRTEVARLLGLPRQTVGFWVQAYESGGEEALASKRRGRPEGSGTKLLPWQAAQIAQALKDRRPEQLKLPFFLWTREAVALLIERRFGIQVSRWTAGRYLKRWGFTPQKPVRRAWEQNDAAVRRWLKEEYPRLRREAKQEGAVIYWGDEMGLRSDHSVGRSYSPKGKTPVIKGAGQRLGCNMISAITNQGALSFMVFKENFTVAVFLRFLRRLIQQSERRVYLIVDGHPAHRAKLVQAWLEKHSERIRMVRLPGLQPGAESGRDTEPGCEEQRAGAGAARHRPELIQRVRSYLHRRQRQPHVVRSYFDECHVRYAAA